MEHRGKQDKTHGKIIVISLGIVGLLMSTTWIEDTWNDAADYIWVKAEEKQSLEKYSVSQT